MSGWSPDGKQLAFGGFEDGLWVLQVHSGQAVHVTTAPFTVPAWSKDGSKLALDLRLPQRETEIWMIKTRSLENLPKVRLPEGALPPPPAPVSPPSSQAPAQAPPRALPNTQTSPSLPSQVPRGPYVVGKLDPADVAAILELVRSTPENVDKRILRIVVERPDEVVVWTGMQRGPLAGGGSTIHLKKLHGKWKIVSYGRWIS